MIIKETGYSYNDLTVVPEVISDIESRSQCNPFVKDNWLPIFTAPMASVVDEHNLKMFTKNGIMPILPRNISLETRKEWMLDYHWVALSLSEFKNEFIEKAHEREKTSYYICVDIANGHMKSLYDICLAAKKLAKKYDYKLTIMTGNIANPKTYEWICNFNYKHSCSVIDYIRVGIGGGRGCITSSNVAIHYPQATLIDKCKTIKNIFVSLVGKEYCPYIIADGGIRNYDNVIVALALGADYVMIGSIFAQCIESAGEKNTNLSIYKDFKFRDNYWYAYYSDKYKNKLTKDANKYYSTTDAINQYINSLNKEQNVGPISVKFFGMASADGQKSINGKKTKTAEGITKYLDVKYTLKGWVENMISYLCSAMSYCDCKELKEFIGTPELIPNSISEIQAVNK